MTPARPLLAANWKMSPLTAAEAAGLARGVTPAATEHADRVEVALFPPFPWLPGVAEALRGTGVGLGAQDCFWERSGAFTGEVSAAMLAGLCGWVIAGHSERRQHLGETDEQVARKAAAALEAGLSVIVCVGEREEQLAAGRTDEVVSGQVRAAVAPLGAAAAAGRLVVAYEPVWAIGTGRSAEPAHAAAAMGLVGRVLAGAIGEEAARRARVLYGGSVNAGNVTAYLALPSCAGCLVGGASLMVEEFSRMIEAVAALP